MPRISSAHFALLLAAPACLITAARAQQPGVTVAGSGYRLPASLITAAPGQLLTFSIFGVAARIPEPVFPVPGQVELPVEVAGIAVEFVQSTNSTPLPIRGVQQSPCPTPGSCFTSTTFTVQMPFELSPEPAARTFLRVRETGRTVTEIAINPVTDNVHIINSCDQTGIFLSAAAELPAGSCAPMIMHTNGRLVSPANPAVRGETLVLWAYGLGALDALPGEQAQAAQPITIGFSYFELRRAFYRRLNPVIPSYAGMPGGGLYQIHFAAPPPPTNLAPCLGSSSGNLRILLSGPTSADSADICLQ